MDKDLLKTTSPKQVIQKQWSGKPGGMNYVRWRYGVPAKRGMLVYQRENGFGHILSASNGKLHIETDNGTFWFHPTDHMKYCYIDCPECNGGKRMDEDGGCYLCEGYGKVDPDTQPIAWDCTVGEWLKNH